MQKKLTGGSVIRSILVFSLPYLLASLLQTLYELADVFIVGLYCHSDAIAAVTNGSQVMHFVTVVLVGLAMGSTVVISQSVGADRPEDTGRAIGVTSVLFLKVALGATAGLLLLISPILSLLNVPKEALSQARWYLGICFAGVPFITAYNILSAIFRGLGDTRRPMVFVALACLINVALDFLFIGVFRMQAIGAALGTVLSQACSVLFALGSIWRRRQDFPVSRSDFRKNRPMARRILRIGLPVAAQDAFIQVSFLCITVIANGQGLAVSTAVGVVEKLIGFLFLVPSAMLSTVSAIAAQNIGAGQHARARQTLFLGMSICLIVGLVFSLCAQVVPEGFVGLFIHEDPEVLRLGSDYLRSYVWDCMIAGVHFCFSGYFCALGKSGASFLHNAAAILLVRIPGPMWAVAAHPGDLYVMGWFAPLGSLLSSVICLILYALIQKKKRQEKPRGTSNNGLTEFRHKEDSTP